MVKDDFNPLREMVYSGRGITVGMTPEGKPFVGYTLTGRSPSSQARWLSYNRETDVIRTEVTDKEILETGNPALLLYPAMIAINGGENIVASNGAQTRLHADLARENPQEYPRFTLTKSMKHPVIEGDIDITSYEPDDPNFTPRISACIDKKNVGFYVIKRATSPDLEQIPEVEIIHSGFELEPGKARIITTYAGGNESPLKSFDGTPLETRVLSTRVHEIVDSLYDAIGPKNGDNYRVSAAVMVLGNGIEVARLKRNGPEGLGK